MKRAGARLLAVVLALSPLAAAAHPHAWIDVRVGVLFDAEGRVTGLRETWLFDEYYTAYAVEGMDEDGDGAPDAARLRALLEENMTNLREFDYFTRVTGPGGKAGYGEIASMSSRIDGNRLEMTFDLPLATPLAVDGDGVTYAVYDPTFYIEMVHAEAADAIALVDAPKGCTSHLEEPQPPEEAVSLAASLDKTETASEGFGALFAQVVTIRCD